MEEQFEIRSKFLSLAFLQGLGRTAKMAALPPPEIAQEQPEWAAFVRLTFDRWQKNINSISPAIIFDQHYNVYEYEINKRDVDVGNMVMGDKWLEIVADILAKDPTKNLMVFYDTVMQVDTNHERGAARMEKFVDMMRNGGGEDPLDWLCKNGGVKINIATLVNIEGIQSQLMFSHNSTETYGRVSDFTDMVGLVQKNSIPLIDANMTWLNKLSETDPDVKPRKFSDLITKQIRKGFVWLDVMHSAPLMEVLQHFGFGYKDDIDAAIGKAVLRRVGDQEGN